jgi:hypothetical protein
MGVALIFDLAPDLLDVMNALVPALSHVCFIRIKPAPMPVMVVGFDIGSRLSPIAESFVAQGRPVARFP